MIRRRLLSLGVVPAFFFLLGSLSFSARASYSDAILEYRILIDDVVVGPTHKLSPGEHKLTIEGRVTNNEIAPGIDGGILQAAFNIYDSGDAIDFAEKSVSYSSGIGWDSAPNPIFGVHFPGVLYTSWSHADVLAETAAIDVSDFNTLYDAIGVDRFDLILSGNFFYDGSETTLFVDALQPEDGWNLVFEIEDYSGGYQVVNGALPAVIVSDEVQLTVNPEPSTAILALAASVVLGGRLRPR